MNKEELKNNTKKNDEIPIDKSFATDIRNVSSSHVESLLRNEQQLKKFTDESGNTIKSLENLAPFEQSFVLHYTGTNDSKEAYYKARIECGQPSRGAQMNFKLGELLLVRSDIQSAIRDISKAKANLIKNRVTNLALGKLTDSFEKHSQRSESIAEIDRQIKILRTQEEKLLANPTFDLDQWQKITDAIESKIRTKDKLQESVMKNAQFVIGTATENKEKTIVRAGSIQINLGDSNNPNNNKEVIEGTFTEAEEIIEEEVHKYEE